MMKICVQISLLLLSITILNGCGVDTFQCDDCEDPFTPDNCIDLHSQFQQGVIHEIATGDTEFFDVSEIEVFNEAFVRTSTLYSLGESKSLISSHFENYIVDITSKEIIGLGPSETPIVGYPDADNLYSIKQQQGDIVINDSTIITKFVAETSIFRTSISNSATEKIASYTSRFTHPDTLLIPNIFFALEIPTLDGFIALVEDEIHFVTVSSTSNRIRTVFEYKRRNWKHFNDDGVVIRNLTEPRRVVDEGTPSHPSFSEVPIVIGHQEGDQTIISDIQEGSTRILNIGSSPEISHDGKFVSVTNGVLIDVYDLETNESRLVSSLNDYFENNPSTFSAVSDRLLFAQRRSIGQSKSNALVQNVAYTDNDPITFGTLFDLTSHFATDTLDFLISRVSKPVVMDRKNVFFILFHHQVDACER